MFKYAYDSDPNDKVKHQGVVLAGDVEVMRTRESFDTPFEALDAAAKDFTSRLSTILGQQSGL